MFLLRIFLCFSVIFLAAICAFLLGFRVAIVPKSMMSSTSLLSSVKILAGLFPDGFFLAKFRYFLSFLAAVAAPLVFLRSIVLPTSAFSPGTLPSKKPLSLSRSAAFLFSYLRQLPSVATTNLFSSIFFLYFFSYSNSLS